MELNWDYANIWQEQANEKKEIFDEPKWRFDCGYKLDFDGSLLRVCSRFYPPHYNTGNYWQGDFTITFLDEEIFRKEFKCDTLDQLKQEVELFTKHYADVVKSTLKR